VTTDIDIDIDAIRRREQAATPGPWKAVDFGDDTDPRTAYGVWGKDDDDLCIFEDVDTLLADAEFIAHARQDIPALLAEIDRLRGAQATYSRAVADAQQERDEFRDETVTLTTELANTSAALTESRTQAATYANEIGALKAELEQMRAERDAFRDSALHYAAQVSDLTIQVASARKTCEAYKDQPQPIFQGTGLSERGEGYNAGTRDMARAVLDTLAEAVAR
jgi:FtsZ-binding cell division protein ZapB